MPVIFRRRSSKGWQPKIDKNFKASKYHDQFREHLDDNPNAQLNDLPELIVNAAVRSGSSAFGPRNAKRPERSRVLLKMIHERRICHDRHERQRLSKSINKQTRKELRAWRTLWADHLLEKFRRTKYLQKINIEPDIGKAYPIDEKDFTSPN